MDLVRHYLDIPLAERNASLQRLIQSLSITEETTVQAVISDKHNPAVKLPIELIIRIFEFLDPFDVWSKRLVGRRWNSVLSSEDLMRSAVSRLTVHDPADSALLRVKGRFTSIADEIRHAESLRHGRPFSSMYFRDDLGFGSGWCPPSPFALKGRHIAYLQGVDRPRSDKVILRDLTSGQAITLQGEAREKISGLTLTSELLAFATYTGLVYTTPLNNPLNVRKATRLPSSSVYNLHGDGHVVACLIRGHDEHTVVIHDAVSTKTRSYTFPDRDLTQGDMPTNIRCLIVNSAQETIDLLLSVGEDVWDSNNPGYTIAKFSARRLSFCSRVVKQDVSQEGHKWLNGGLNAPVFEFSLKGQYGSSHIMTHALPAGRKGLFQLSSSEDRTVHTPSILYDSNTMTFTRILYPSCCECVRLDDGFVISMPAFWKDREYSCSVSFFDHGTNEYLSNPERPVGLAVIMPQPHDIVDDSDGHYGHCIKRNGSSYNFRYIPPDLERPPTHEVLSRFSFVDVNDSFAVLVLPENNMIQIFCFDERVHLHGAQPTGLWSEIVENPA